jgi:hypothetical protein
MLVIAVTPFKGLTFDMREVIWRCCRFKPKLSKSLGAETAGRSFSSPSRSLVISSQYRPE